MRHAKTAQGSSKLLLAMSAAGLKITPQSVGELGWDAFFSDASALPAEFKAALLQLQQEVLAIKPPQPAAKPEQPSAGFAVATTNPLSEAARGTLHDRIRQRRRPGGKLMPRPRWSVDAAPLGGWEDGTERVKQGRANKAKRKPVVQPEPKAIIPSDPKLAAILAAMKPAGKTKRKRRKVHY